MKALRTVTTEHKCPTCAATFIGESYAKYCSNKCKQKYYRDNKPGWQRNMQLKKNYGITLEQWDEMFETQGRVCASCGVDDPGGKGWHTDHSHLSGRVRGILCHRCNVIEGLAGSDPDVLLQICLYMMREGK